MNLGRLKYLASGMRDYDYYDTTVVSMLNEINKGGGAVVPVPEESQPNVIVNSAYVMDAEGNLMAMGPDVETAVKNLARSLMANDSIAMDVPGAAPAVQEGRDDD